MIYGEEFRKFVAEHNGEEPAKLLLRYSDKGNETVQAAISHIEACGKGRKKLPSLPAGWVFPSAISVEQATPEKTARLNHRIALEAFRKYTGEETPRHVLDMTTGLGMDALGFARDGNRLTLCEMNHKHAEALRHNFRDFSMVEVIEGDSTVWLREYEGEKLSIVFVDPARRSDTGSRVYNLHHCAPDITALLPLLRKKCLIAVVKISPMLDITQTLRDLPDCVELHVAEENGECRDLHGKKQVNVFHHFLIRELLHS